MIVWRLIFAAAALFTLFFGLGLLIQPTETLGMMGQEVPASLVYVQIAGLAISVHGVGYAIAAMEPLRNKAILFLGVLGKGGTPLLAWTHFQAGAISSSTFAATAVDGAFAVLFLVFLLTTGRR